MPQPLAMPLPAQTCPAALAEQAPVTVPAAANDDVADPEERELLRAAQRLAAEHGARAARFADARAEQAFFAGERAAHRWWQAVTRILDRTLVAELQQRRRRPSPRR